MSDEAVPVPVDSQQVHRFRAVVEFTTVGYDLPDGVAEQAVVRGIRNADHVQVVTLERLP